MIMNGSILSLVYPISIFIYALLEEKRPRKGYWLFILNFTAVVLIFKFLFQTYPISTWVSGSFIPEGKDRVTPSINSVNDILMTLRFGLESLDNSGRNFIKFFIFECLILLTVTLHILVLIFGGLWSQREVDAETIDAAANRIATNKALQRQKTMLMLKKSKTEDQNHSSSNSFKTDSLFDSTLFTTPEDPSVYPPNHKALLRPRSYSMNNCTNMRQVRHP